MCARYSLTTSYDAIRRALLVRNNTNLQPRYNIAPTQQVPAVRTPADDAGQRELVTLHWGLVPAWARDPSIGARMINARAEALAEKPAFRDSFRKRRCLVLADGYYEWQQSGGKKLPWRYILRDGGLFAMAGLWSQWRSPVGEEIESCTIATTAANTLAAAVHHRMPVILDAEVRNLWLDPGAPTAALQQLLRPFPAEAMTAYRVATVVNNVRKDEPACIEPLAEAAPPAKAPSLFD